MLRTLLIGYMSLYAIVWVGVYLAASACLPNSQQEPLWEMVLDVLLLAAGFIGMMLYIRNVQHPELRLAWKIIAPSLVLVHALQFVRHLRKRPRLLEELEMSNRAGVWHDVVATALLVPSLAVNLVYGYF